MNINAFNPLIRVNYFAVMRVNCSPNKAGGSWVNGCGALMSLRLNGNHD